jgi:predicted ABC-type transport system involved in lysophospholipase L1 biosynthesis ATPase subunit
VARVEGVSLAVAPGDVVALTGETGCGKNLILRLLGLLEAPDHGEVLLEGQPTAQLTDDARIELRNRRCGYLFAAPFLLSAFNAAENVAMPIFKISQLSPEEARDRTEALLRFVGLDSTVNHLQLPPRLHHRVALARALANLPAAIFVEDLDTLLEPDDLPEFRRLLHATTKEWGVAVVATAQPSLAPVDGERRFEVADGRIVCEVEF